MPVCTLYSFETAHHLKILNCKLLQDICNLTLIVGNALNFGTHRGNASGSALNCSFVSKVLKASCNIFHYLKVFICALSAV